MAHLKGTGIVVDEIAYDCSSWADEHPGGDSMIQSFGDQDCSWQFWHLHNKDMAKYRQALRIGKTQGVVNRYPEPKRYSRLRGFDFED
jgi:cytochrome b involved in lipid metabolism